MSESKPYQFVVIGVLAYVTYLSWVNLWFLILLPVAIIFFITLEVSLETDERNKELEIKLAESEDRCELYREEYRAAKSFNEILRERFTELQNELEN